MDTGPVSRRYHSVGFAALLLSILLMLSTVACADPSPDAPANQRYGYEYDGSVVLEWDASADAESYTVYHSGDSSGVECRPDSDSRRSCKELSSDIQWPGYTHHSPSPGDNHYWVAACNDSGCSEVDSDSPAQPPPPTPRNGHAAAEGPTIRLVWDPVPEATHYEVHDCAGPGPSCIALDQNVAATAYTHILPPPQRPSGLKVIGRTHDSLTLQWQVVKRQTESGSFYLVTACNNAGCSKGAQIPVSGGTWSQVDYYLVHQRSQEDGHKLVDSRPFRPPYIDEGLRPNAVYYYTVQACNDSGCSDESEESGGLTESDGPVDAPSIPTGVRGHKFQVSLDTDDAGVSWKSVENATYYEIYQETDFDEEISAPGTSYRDYSPNSSWGAFYTTSYKVRACNKAGCSPFSQVVTVK